MNDLDENILGIFKTILDSKEKYLTKIDYNNSSLIYSIGGKKVIIFINPYYQDKENVYTTVNQLANHTSYMDFNQEPDNKEIKFALFLEGKYYIVPNMNRVEHAIILEKIDTILQKHEQNIILKIGDELSGIFKSC